MFLVGIAGGFQTEFYGGESMILCDLGGVMRAKVRHDV